MSDVKMNVPSLSLSDALFSICYIDKIIYGPETSAMTSEFTDKVYLHRK